MPTKSSIINETIANATEINQTIAIQPTAVLKHDNLLNSISSSIESISSSMESISNDLMDTVAKTVDSNPSSQIISHKQKRSMSSNQSTLTVLQSIASNAQIRADDTDDVNSRNGRKMKTDKLNRNDGVIGRINVVIHNISVITDVDYSDEVNLG